MGGSTKDKLLYSDISSLVTLLVLSLRTGRQGFPLAIMDISPGYFHSNQKENRSKRTSRTTSMKGKII